MGRSARARVLNWAAAMAAGTVAVTSAQHFTEWSSPVNLGEVVNSTFNDQQPALSPDGLSLYFVSNRPWSAPENLGPAVNSPWGDNAPAFSRDGRSLFFDSDRPGGLGGRDLYLTTRAKVHPRK